MARNDLSWLKMHDFITALWSLHSASQTKAYHCNCTKQGGLVPPAFIYSRLKKWTWHCAFHYVVFHLSIHSLKDWAFCPHARRHFKKKHIFLSLQWNCNYSKKKHWNSELKKKKNLWNAQPTIQEVKKRQPLGGHVISENVDRSANQGV